MEGNAFHPETEGTDPFDLYRVKEICLFSALQRLSAIGIEVAASLLIDINR